MAIGEFGGAPASPGDGGLVLSGPMYWWFGGMPLVDTIAGSKLSTGIREERESNNRPPSGHT